MLPYRNNFGYYDTIVCNQSKVLHDHQFLLTKTIQKKAVSTYSCSLFCSQYVIRKQYVHRHTYPPSLLFSHTTDIADEFAYEPKDLTVVAGTEAELTCEPPEGSPKPMVFSFLLGKKCLYSNDSILNCSCQTCCFSLIDRQFSLNRYNCTCLHVLL